MNRDEWMREALEANTPDLLRYFLRRTHHDDAADLVHDVVLVAWRRRHEAPRETVALRMWLYGVARRTLAAAHRATLRRSDLVGRVGHNLAADHDTGPDQETRLFVQEMLDALPPRQREIVLLVHWDGFTLVEAARMLKVTPSTARTHYQRARAFLREVLVDESDEAQPPEPSTALASAGATGQP